MHSVSSLIKKDYLLITLVIFAAIFFGLFFFKNQFYFYFDQARDAYEAYSIYHNADIKIQGPSTDISGLYHGVGWYYFLAIPYLVGRENPFFSGLFLFFLVFLTLPFVWKLSNSMFKDNILSLALILLVGFSPAIQIGARWLSNPTLSLVVVPFLLLIFWSFIENRKRWKAFLIGLLFGLMLHANLAYLICIFSIPIIFLLLKFRIKLNEILFFFLGFIIPLSTIIIAEIKFGGNKIIQLGGQLGGSSSNHTLINLSGTVVQKISEYLNITFFNVDLRLFIALLVISVFLLRKKINSSEKKALLFLIGWMFTFFLFLIFDTGISRSQFVFFPYILPGIIIFGFILRKIIPNKKIFFLALIVIIFLQINTNIKFINSKINPYTVQKGMILTDLYKVVDYTYKESSGQKFSLNSITSPLYINTTWAYLYEFYGKRKYGFLPNWDGKDQAGYLGNLPKGDKTQLRFTIIEPGPGIPDAFAREAIKEEDSKSRLVSEKKIGTLIVQKRISK